jgi:cell division septum initiation protein DivIVA
VVFEKLAAQLREPLFRTSEAGYDPDDVRGFLDETAARLAVLEDRVAKAEQRAEHAERRLSAARRYAAGGAGSDTGILDEVVFAGQRRAEEIGVEAVAAVDRVRSEALARVGAARSSVDDPVLRTEVGDQRQWLRRQRETCHIRQADLEVVDRAVSDARRSILTGLERELAELSAMPFLLAKEARP